MSVKDYSVSTLIVCIARWQRVTTRRFVDEPCRKRYAPSMSKKETRKIELDAAAVDVLEARAVERGISVSDLIVDLLGPETDWPDDLENMRQDGRGPWSPQALA